MVTWFRNPKQMWKELGESYDIVRGETKSKLETELGRNVFRDKESLRQMEVYIKNVAELQDMGVINQ